MAGNRAAERKPLSFSTTMRNPMRIADFLKCLLPYENQVLTHSIIMKIVRNVISCKLYRPVYVGQITSIKLLFDDEDAELSEQNLDDIIINSPQQHKEYGFDNGWDSRFDTWYKLPKEFGFVYYNINQPIIVSNTGHMLIDAINENPINDEKIQNVFLNALMKYQSDNPFRKNLNSNVPLILLLQVIKLLKNDLEENGAGIYRQELSLFICWPDNNATCLYQKIKEIRRNRKFTYSDEYMYDICLELLNAHENQKNRFKITQLCGEAVDEYIRKMRSTGIISLRGHGRFIDFNMIEEERINYVLENYGSYSKFTNENDFFNYMGTIDSNVLCLEQSETIDIDGLRKNALYKFAQEYTVIQINEELVKVCHKRESSDPLLRYISGPLRLEFLTSIALVQNFENLDVNPNYIVDDEGLPICTAGGNSADIICCDDNYDSMYEVTLMCGRSDQINNEIIPIRRHLIEAKAKTQNVFSVFIAPHIHQDTKEAARLYRVMDNLDILTYEIEEFILAISHAEKTSNLLI